MRVALFVAALTVAVSIAGCGVRVSLGYDDDASSDGGVPASDYDSATPEDAEPPTEASADDVETDASIDADDDAAVDADLTDASVD